MNKITKFSNEIKVYLIRLQSLAEETFLEKQRLIQ